MGYESTISRTPDAEQPRRTLDNGASKDAAKRNIKRFKDAEVDDEDSDGDAYTESQQELLGEYVEVEEIIADAQLQLESIQKRRRHTFKALYKSLHFSFLLQ